MKREIEYQQCFDVSSEIDFAGELTEDGHHIVRIQRRYPDGIFGDDTIICVVGWNDDGELMSDKLHNCTDEEIDTILEMMDSISSRNYNNVGARTLTWDPIRKLVVRNNSRTFTS